MQYLIKGLLNIFNDILKFISKGRGGCLVCFGQNVPILNFITHDTNGFALLIDITCYEKTATFINIVNADASGQTRITNNSSAYECVPSWSPDATHIVYASDKENGYKIFKLDADGSGTPIKLSSNDTDRAPFWSPLK